MQSTPNIADTNVNPDDSGLVCPVCEYNLTGIPSERCPECGTTINWEVARRLRDLGARQLGPVWERTNWWSMPIAFVRTALQAALMPWQLARQIQPRPPVLYPLGFLVICMASGMLVAWWFADADAGGLSMWSIGVACQVLLQTLVFAWLLPPWRCDYRLRFWFAASAYTSYPLLLEGLGAPPYILNGLSTIWPLSKWLDSPVGDESMLATILYYLWWLGLGIIAWVRLAPRQRRRVALIVVAIPVMTYASSYAGCYLGDKLAGGIF